MGIFKIRGFESLATDGIASLKRMDPRTPVAFERGSFCEVNFALGLLTPGYDLVFWVTLPMPSWSATPNIPGGVMLSVHLLPC